MVRLPAVASHCVSIVLLASCAAAPPAPTPAPSAPTAASAPAPAPERKPPVPTPREYVADTYHGTKVADPYRWLEEDSERVTAWTKAQNARTRTILDAISQRDEVAKSIERLMSAGDVAPPKPRRTPWGAWRYFYQKREGLQNQPTLYVREGLKGEDMVVFDVNTLAADGTASLDWFFPSPDGRRVAYGVSLEGSEESTLYVREIGRGGKVEQLADEIPRTRYCSIAWKPDGSGFYYTRYPKAGEVPEGEEHYHRAVFVHALGSNPEDDPRIFGEGRAMTDSPSVELSPNGRWLVVHVHQGWAKSELYLRDMARPKSAFVPVAVGKEAIYYPIVTNNALYVLTNDGAPRSKLVRVNPTKPSREHWQDVIPEGEHTLDDVNLIGKEFIATYLRDASSELVRFDMQGKRLGDIELPVLGTARVRGARNGSEAFVGFTSFAVKSDVYRVPLDGTGKRELWQQVDTPIEADVQVDQFFATSKDGTRVPYFAVRRRGVSFDGTAPAVLAAYGGFNISVVPQFLRGAGVVLEHGGVFVQANLRGGGEYGEAWHKAGMFENKQNVFDDMIAVAEDVKARKVAAPDRLAVTGGSNGGLLVGAMIVQRPELFRVAVARVPLMDMLRYQNFLIAKLWIPEYGEASDPKVFPALLAYSPYHNVEKGVAYPATLLTAAESDTRVHPLHARKMAAALQWATSSDEPILLRIETKAGHGVGKPVSKRIEEYADVYSFMMWKLGMLK
ncbi:MAG: prolyl oligopeptidase family serine peptidase [Myxococcota bacterium]